MPRDALPRWAAIEIGFRGQRRHAPAGDGGAGRIGAAPGQASAAQQETGQARGLGGELQAAGRGAVEFRHLADRGGQPPRAQGFLQRPEHLAVVARPHQDQPPRIEAEAGQPRCIEIARRRCPKDRPNRSVRQRRAQPGEQRQAEAAGRAVVPFGPLAVDLVQPGERQAAARQMLVQRRLSQGQDPQRPRPGAAFENADAGAQGLERFR